MSQIYQTTVKAVGSEAGAFADQGMCILFGDGAPAELADYCFNIVINECTGDIEPGQKLVIDGKEFPVTAVGGLVRKNLEGLGHITINFNGAEQAQLEGTLHVAGEAPTIDVGSTIGIEA